MPNEKSRLLFGSFQTKEDVIFRIPLLPFCNTEVTQHLNVEVIGPAIYSSSINLYRKHIAASVARKSETTTLFPSIVRYCLRASTRPTPFGFFAGCGVVQWQDQIRVDNQSARYHTRPDHLVMHQLAQRLLAIPALQPQLRYFPNGSLYQVHDELRYVEYTLSEQKRDYRLSAVADSDSLVSVMHYAQTGARFSKLTGHLVQTYQVLPKEAEVYLRELINNQLLVHELEPAVTGEEYLPRLIRWVESVDDTTGDHDPTITEVLTLLRDLDHRLAQIKARRTTVIEQGPLIVNLLRPWLPELTENKLFQVDTIFPVSEANPSADAPESIPAQLSEAIAVLNRLAPVASSPSLTRFAERFTARYGDREVPLAEALDSEVGINYLNNVPAALSPLVEELHLPITDEQQWVTETPLQRWQQNLLQTALFHQQTVVALTDEMLKDFTANEEDLPPSMSVMFRRVEGTSKNTNFLYLDSVGGVSATSLINRFAHADPSIHRVVQDICQQEQRHNPDVIFAEIVHLPESRVGNIMFHPTSRTYEIPYLATSAVDKDHQLSLSDLLVSVRGGRVVLRSQQLDQEIIPRLSVAHNYRLSELAVYRFLCDLQGQGLRSYLSFDWGPLAARSKFLPRVTYKNVILHPATWRLNAEDFSELKTATSFKTAFRAFCRHWRLPRRWVLADGDNELFVDVEQSLIVEAWWDLARKREQLTIKEFFAPAGGAVVNEQGEAHAHQLVASWVKQVPTYRGIVPNIPATDKGQRSFAPGTEWLYYKLYGGPSSADRVLEEAIAPLVEQWQAEQKITSWFFIRYADPDPHLRLRFRLHDTAYLGEAMQRVRETLAPFTDSGMLHRVQLDTYERELERYGSVAIIEAEALFHYDSEATLRFLSLTEGDAREDLRWLWGLRSIDALLIDFGLSTSEKLGLLEGMKDSFAREHRMDKPLRRQLDKKYRTHRSTIYEMLTLNDPDGEFYPLVEVLQKRSARQAGTVAALRAMEEQNEIVPGLTNLLRSYIHLLVNRLIPSQARFHEMVLYDFLYRQYRSKIAREKQSTVR